MQYIINDIPDPVFTKSILYGCPCILEFKQMVKIYDKFRNNFVKNKSHFQKTKSKHNEKLVSNYENVKPESDARPNMNIRIKYCLETERDVIWLCVLKLYFNY